MYSVLHIEQSEFFKKTLQEMLLERGYMYREAYDLDEAYEILMKEKVDLIITSLMIGDQNIKKFIKTINKSGKKNIPIFVVTGDKLNDDKKILLNMGISDYILKNEFFNEISKHIELVFKEDELIKDLRKAKIAVLDDSNFEISFQKNILERYDVKNVDYYTSGKELLESGKIYDVYLIDVVLKNEFGKNIVMKIRRNNEKCSIIAVSSLDNPKTIASILNSGANDYINKPIEEDLYIAKLKSNIRTYSLQNQILELHKELMNTQK